MYADKITPAMEQAIEETKRRREKQRAYNEAHGITPRTVVKSLMSLDPSMGERDYVALPSAVSPKGKPKSPEDLREQVELLRSEMLLAAENLDFEKAAQLRDQIRALEGGDAVGEKPNGPKRKAAAGAKGPRKSGVPTRAAKPAAKRARR